MKKVANKKSIKLDSTFLPKRKRVLNKRALPILNKPVMKRPKVDNVLDSQCSIGSCFVDSQARGPSSPVPVSDRVGMHVCP